MPRFPAVPWAGAVRAKGVVDACEEATAKARAAYRRELLKALRAGVTKTTLAHELGTSESRIRQTLHQAAAEAEIARPA
jgi:hypothetical protein